MPAKFIDLVGRKVGRLTVVSLRDRVPVSRWNCLCSCGTWTVVAGGHLRANRVLSCGCYARDRTSETQRKHGMSKTPTYVSWRSMLQRCSLPSVPSFARYRERGITVAASWLDFEQFFADMGERPPGTSIDRIDNTKGYAPGNCRWATPAQQQANKSNSVLLTHGGVTKPAAVWSKALGLSPGTVQGRIGRGWPVEEAVTAPKGTSLPWLRKKRFLLRKKEWV